MRQAKKSVGAQRGLSRILAVVLTLLFVSTAGLLILPYTETEDTTPVSGSANWMAGLPDETLLSKIVLPGTHDSATQYVQLAYFSRCQSLGIAEQLDAGVRYLDIRLGDPEKSGEALRLMHDLTVRKTGLFGGTLTLDEVLEDCRAFLAQHPSEKVLFAVKHEHGDMSGTDFQRILLDVIQKDESLWLLRDRIPTLGEARGRLVLLRRWEDEAGLGPEAGVPLLWENQSGHADLSLNAVTEDQGGYLLRVQDRYEYGLDDRGTAFTAGLEAPTEEGSVLISFLSTKGMAAYGHPYAFAARLNQRLKAMDPAALRGWIIVDYVSPKLAERIYGVNQGE